MRRWVRWTLIGFIVLVVGDCLGVLPFEPIARLVGGWAIFAGRELPAVRVNWEGVAGAAVCLAGVAVVGHSTCAWFWRGTERPGRWRARWTAAGVIGVVTMFTAGLAVTGVGHQVVWLAKSDEPIMTMQYGGRAANRVRCASNMRQIGAAIRRYVSSHDGRWPGDLSEVLQAGGISAELLVCPASDDEKAPGQTPEERARNLKGHLSYVYYGRGWRGTAGAARVVMSEPLANHDREGVTVLFGDGHVGWVPAGHAREVLRGE